MADEDEGPSEDQQAEQEALHRLKGMDLASVLQAGHEASLRLLSARAIAGTASHQELAILRNMLRDNGMVMGKVIDGSKGEPLPFPDDLPALSKPEYL